MREPMFGISPLTTTIYANIYCSFWYKKILGTYEIKIAYYYFKENLNGYNFDKIWLNLGEMVVNIKCIVQNMFNGLKHSHVQLCLCLAYWLNHFKYSTESNVSK